MIERNYKKMKNKLIIAFLLVMLGTFFITGQDKSDNSKPVNTITTVNSGFEVFLNQNLGKDISVTINNLDVTIVGKLVAVYQDSLIVQTLFNKQILILKNSIAYIKTGIEKK